MDADLALIGRQLGNYAVQSVLGTGGMGTVYRARDTTLEREVAIKILPPSFAVDPERVRRFQREARVLASLNHPHISTLYGFEEIEGIRALVLELVEGPTLASHLSAGPMPVAEALTIARQVVEAVEAAHEKGIIHRDLKPANIKLTRAGQAKVLDFGLAKALVGGDSDSFPSDVSTVTASESRFGVIVGTPAYMSPEQSRGDPVDKRTDIWAFGCVLYEMLAGRSAFGGETLPDTVAAILGREPNWQALPQGVPLAVRRLLKRCLEKDAQRRLRDITSVGFAIDDALSEIEAPPATAGGTSATSHAGRGGQRNILWAAMTAIAVVTVGAVTLWMRQGHSTTDAAPTAGVEILRPAPLTSYSGTERSPSFSRDGSLLAFAWDGESHDNFDIYVKRVDSAPPFRLTRDPAEEDNPIWSPDGGSIAFLRIGPPTAVRGQVIVVPALGGPERVVVDDDVVRGTLDWSPDGKWLVYRRRSASEPEGLWIRSLDSGEQRRLTTATGPGAVDSEARFSPNGRSLAFVRGPIDSSDLYLLDLDEATRATGAPRRLTSDGVNHHSPQWLPDGAELVDAAGAPGIGYIERLPSSGGRARQLMSITAQEGFAVSATANRLLVSASISEFDIHRVELSADGAQALSVKPLVVSSRHDAYPLYSPNGERIVFASTRSGSWQIWACNGDGSSAVQLTDLKSTGTVAYPTSWKLPIGGPIGFVHDVDGTRRAYMIDPGVGIPRRVPELANVTSAIQYFWWSRNGSWIVYVAEDGVWKLPAAGGTPVRLGNGGGASDFDGNSAVVNLGRRPPNTGSGWYSVPLDGATPRAIGSPNALPSFESILLHPGEQGRLGRYLLEFPSFTSFETTPGQLMLQRWSTNELLRVTGVEGASGRFGMSLSPNGRFLLYTKFVSSGADLMVVEHFR